jgi:hypothetical protein
LYELEGKRQRKQAGKSKERGGREEKERRGRIDLQGCPDPQFQDTSSPFFNSSAIVYYVLIMDEKWWMNEG